MKNITKLALAGAILATSAWADDPTAVDTETWTIGYGVYDALHGKLTSIFGDDAAKFNFAGTYDSSNSTITLSKVSTASTNTWAGTTEPPTEASLMIPAKSGDFTIALATIATPGTSANDHIFNFADNTYSVDLAFKSYTETTTSGEGEGATTSATITSINAPANSSYLFYGNTSLKSVDFSGLDTTSTTNISSMFQGCTAITAVDLSVFDKTTATITNMSDLFNGCSNLESVLVSKTFASKTSVTTTGMFTSAGTTNSDADHKINIYSLTPWDNVADNQFSSTVQGLSGVTLKTGILSDINPNILATVEEYGNIDEHTDPNTDSEYELDLSQDDSTIGLKQNSILKITDWNAIKLPENGTAHIRLIGSAQSATIELPGSLTFTQTTGSSGETIYTLSGTTTTSLPAGIEVQTGITQVPVADTTSSTGETSGTSIGEILTTDGSTFVLPSHSTDGSEDVTSNVVISNSDTETPIEINTKLETETQSEGQEATGLILTGPGSFIFTATADSSGYTSGTFSGQDTEITFTTKTSVPQTEHVYYSSTVHFPDPRGEATDDAIETALNSAITEEDKAALLAQYTFPIAFNITSTNGTIYLTNFILESGHTITIRRLEDQEPTTTTTGETTTGTSTENNG